MRNKILLILSAISMSFLLSNPIVAKNKKAAFTMPPVFVETALVTTTPVKESIHATGTLRAINGIQVRPEIPGRITEIFFKSGQDVKKGDKLIQINPAVLNATVNEAKAKAKLAKQSYARFAKLYVTRTVSKSDVDKAQADLHSAEAALEQAQAQLDLSLIRAPFSGRVGLKNFSIGDYVTIGQILVSLQELDPIDVAFTLPETNLGCVNIGQKVELSSPAYPQKIFSGKIYALDSLVNPLTRSIGVRARVPNQDKKLLPGTFAEVSIPVVHHNQLAIPQTAVTYVGGKVFVYKVEHDKAILSNVDLGVRDDKNVIVKSGLKKGDIVVTAGQIKLHDGANVVVTNRKAG